MGNYLSYSKNNELLLLNSLRQGETEQFKSLLSEVDPNNDWVFKAVFYSQLEILKILLEDPRLNPCTETDLSISYAAQCNNIEILELLLLDTRFDPSVEDNHAIESVIYDKTKLKSAKLLLLDNRVQPNLTKYFRVAVFNYCLDTVKLILSEPSFIPNEFVNMIIPYQRTELWYSSDVLKLLIIDNRFNPAAINNEAIRFASEHNHSDIVALLLSDPRVDPGTDDNLPILRAARHGYFVIVKLLINDDRVDPCARNNATLWMAADSGHFETVKVLLSDPRVNPCDGNNAMLRISATNGHTEVVKLLLNDHRFQIYDNILEDILRVSADNGQSETVKLLEQYQEKTIFSCLKINRRGSV
jgi:ankyrin repeat protein